MLYMQANRCRSSHAPKGAWPKSTLSLCSLETFWLHLVTRLHSQSNLESTNIGSNTDLKYIALYTLHPSHVPAPALVALYQAGRSPAE
jgi:hypothetical protein